MGDGPDPRIDHMEKGVAGDDGWMGISYQLDQKDNYLFVLFLGKLLHALKSIEVTDEDTEDREFAKINENPIDRFSACIIHNLEKYRVSKKRHKNVIIDTAKKQGENDLIGFSQVKKMKNRF